MSGATGGAGKRIGYLLRQGPRVIGFRLGQRIGWEWQRRSHFWPRLERRVREAWTDTRVRRWRDGDLRPAAWLAPDGLAAFESWAASEPVWTERTLEQAARARRGTITIFDQPHAISWEQAPWNTDWRYGHTWPGRYYRDYSFYEPHKATPYDVKFPWELSRFGFAFPVLQAGILQGDAGAADWVAERLLDWEAANPCGDSVNWCAMECSMRMLALAQLVGVMAAWRLAPDAALAPLLRQLALQGEFVRRNLEVSRIPGNHYAANLAALAVAGATLGRAWPAARGWAGYARPRLLRQLDEQFLPDGVHFEKSTAYHRLVTEMFLLAMRAGETTAPWPLAARQRLQAACDFTLAATRCDGWAANFGDNDSARVLAWDPWPVRDHRAVPALGAVEFHSPSLRGAAPSAALAWFTGRAGLEAWERMPAAEPPRAAVFPAGGMLAARGEGGYLLADFGEVGQRGLGGHGHNDLFSFEFCARGTPVIVDAGSPVYTGDLQRQLQFRSTRAHNTVSVDGAEMAPLLGPWRIANTAVPRKVQWQLQDGGLAVSGEHAGFSREREAITVSRRLSFEAELGRLRCEDLCHSAGDHRLLQRFHFAPGLEVRLGDTEAVVLRDGKPVAHLRWNAAVEARLDEDLVSDNYGQCSAAATLELVRQAGPAWPGPFTVEIAASA